MTHTYLLPMARNTITGQRIKTQDLTGARFAHSQRVLAQGLAEKLAAQMTARTGDLWTGFLETYTPSVRR